LTLSRLYRCIISPGITEIYSNTKVIPGFFPVIFDRQISLAERPAAIKIYFFVNKFLDQKTSKATEEKGKGPLLQEFRLFPHVKAKIEIDKLAESPIITVNQAYYKLGRVRINNFSPPGVHLRDVLLAKLVSEGYLPLHGSAFASSSKGTLIIGPPSIGKTTVLLDAVTQGYQFLADDLTISNANGKLFPCPAISSLAYEFAQSKTIRGNWKNSISAKKRLAISLAKLPLLNLFTQPPYIGMTQLTQHLKVADKAKLTRIFILARGENSLKKIPIDEAFRLIWNFNRIEFSYGSNQMLLRYSCLNRRFDVSEILKWEEIMIKQLLNECECYLCTAPAPEQYFSLINRT
jgi:hypothetical protein